MSRALRAFIAVAACALVAAVADSRAVAAGGQVVHGRITVDGKQRTYRQFVPPRANERRSPIVVVLHGGGRKESGDSIAAATGFDAQAAKHGWIALYPDAESGRFRAGRCCGQFAHRGDDVRFIARLLRRVADRHRIDRRRVFATGFSNGGFMAYRLACRQSRVFSAIAVVAAKLTLARCRPERPVSLLHIHARDDAKLSFERGVFRWDSGGVLQTVARWRQHDRCARGATQVTRTPELAVSRTTRCADGTQVALVALSRGGHVWPGANEPYGDGRAPYDASDQIGRFFAALPPRRR